DNRVPKGTFPKTIAFGDQTEMTIHDPVAFINIERYQKINVNAATPGEVYPAAALMSVAANAGFLKECIRRIPLVRFTDRDNGIAYLAVRDGNVEVLDAAVLSRVMNDSESAAAISEIAPRLSAGRS
ncbi:MAG: hypothetical protein WAU35_13280, partial [Azonexus sp.]